MSPHSSAKIPEPLPKIRMIGFKRMIDFKDSEQTEIKSEIHCLIREKDEAIFEVKCNKEKIKALEERIRKLQLSKDSKYQKDTAL